MNTRLLFGSLVGSLYAALAVLQGMVSVGVLEESPLLPSDPMGAFVLAVVGTTFLFGVRELWEGQREGVAFVYVGIGLALVFAAVYALSMGAAALSAWMAGETIGVGSISPLLYLGLAPLMALAAWREGFSLRGG